MIEEQNRTMEDKKKVVREIVDKRIDSVVIRLKYIRYKY